MKATTENLIALGVGYKFDGKKTVFNLADLKKSFEGISYQEDDVKDLSDSPGSIEEYIDIKDVDFSNSKFIQPEEVEVKEEIVFEKKSEEIVEDKSPIVQVEEKPKKEVKKKNAPVVKK